MIEKLKALIDDHRELESKFNRGQVPRDVVISALGKKLAALEDLAPELIALWEAVPRVLGDHLKCPDCRCDWMPVGPARDDLAKAYSALNAKAAEVLK